MGRTTVAGARGPISTTRKAGQEPEGPQDSRGHSKQGNSSRVQRPILEGRDTATRLSIHRAVGGSKVKITRSPRSPAATASVGEPGAGLTDTSGPRAGESV